LLLLPLLLPLLIALGTETAVDKNPRMSPIAKEQVLNKSPGWDMWNGMLAADPIAWSFQNNNALFLGGDKWLEE